MSESHALRRAAVLLASVAEGYLSGKLPAREMDHAVEAWLLEREALAAVPRPFLTLETPTHP